MSYTNIENMFTILTDKIIKYNIEDAKSYNEIESQYLFLEKVIAIEEEGNRDYKDFLNINFVSKI